MLGTPTDSRAMTLRWIDLHVIREQILAARG
jgi:hypothetical protein